MAHFLQGEIYLYKNDPQRALAEFQKELEINPTVWLVYWRLGDSYMHLRRYDEADKLVLQPHLARDQATARIVRRVFAVFGGGKG